MPTKLQRENAHLRRRIRRLTEQIRGKDLEIEALKARARETEQEPTAGRFQVSNSRTSAIGDKGRALQHGVEGSGQQAFSVPRMQAAWGEGAPDWIVALAEACDRTSQSKAAKLLGVSAPLVCQALGKRYTGRMDWLEAKVREKLGRPVD